MPTGAATDPSPAMRSRLLEPLPVACAYVLAAAAWIPGSGWLAERFGLPVTAQALLFALGSAFALFFVLRAQSRRSHQQALALDATARAYRLLFDRHPLPSWVCDADSGRILTANAAAIDFQEDGHDPTGQSLTSVLGRSADDDATLVGSGPGHDRSFRLVSAPCSFADRPAMLYLARELTEERIALARAHRYSEEMKLLTRRLLNAQEAERRAIARQLHDQLGQTLTVARLLVESTLESIDDARVRDVLGEAMQALESGLKETRTLTGNLRPPMLDDLGLVPTLRWLVDRHTAGRGVTVTLELPPDPGPLESETDVAAYRIADEAIDNALQHGAPSRLRVRLRLRQRLVTLTVDDDGRGFDPEHVLAGLVPFGRSGLLGARERAEALGGALRIRSRPGAGTIVRAILPRRPPSP